MLWKLFKVAAIATCIFLFGIALCVVHYFNFPHNTDFACRWTGECTGWTKTLVIRNTLGNLEYWWAYTAISTAILLFHPVVEGVRESRRTILMTWAFILTCGGAHLLFAYSNFNPLYVVETGYLELTAPVSCLAVFPIGSGLLRVRALSAARRAQASARIAELEAQLEAQSKQT